jgi:peroxiredoxin
MRSLLLLAVLAVPVAAQDDKAAIGKEVKDFKLRDLMKDEEKTYSLSEFKGKKHLVLVWISEKCDITWRYEKRTGALLSEFGKDAQFFAVTGSGNDTLAGIRKYAESKNYGMPVLDDVKSEMTRYFNISVTPTYVVIDKDGKLRYRGACDDLQAGAGFGADESTAKVRYVADALKAILEGKDPEVTEKKGFG